MIDLLDEPVVFEPPAELDDEVQQGVKRQLRAAEWRALVAECAARGDE